jgi:hypothetical protein
MPCTVGALGPMSRSKEICVPSGEYADGEDVDAFAGWGVEGDCSSVGRPSRALGAAILGLDVRDLFQPGVPLGSIVNTCEDRLTVAWNTILPLCCLRA